MPQSRIHPRQSKWKLAIQGHRLPLFVVFENLEAGTNIAEISEWFHISQEEILTVLSFVTRSLNSAPHLPKSVPELVDAHTV